MKYFRYHNTHCFFIESSTTQHLLALDAGWPCTLYEYQRCMKQIGLDYRNITKALVTHFHMDHAGLLGEFIQSGISCYAFDTQVGYVSEMERIIGKNKEYRTYQKIDTNKLIKTTAPDFEKLSAVEGFYGKVLYTKGHSPDSISYITADGEALIGDLSPLDQVMPDDTVSNQDWNAIKLCGARLVYPSHAEIFPL